VRVSPPSCVASESVRYLKEEKRASPQRRRRRRCYECSSSDESDSTGIRAACWRSTQDGVNATRSRLGRWNFCSWSRSSQRLQARSQAASVRGVGGSTLPPNVAAKSRAVEALEKERAALVWDPSSSPMAGPLRAGTSYHYCNYSGLPQQVCLCMRIVYSIVTRYAVKEACLAWPSIVTSSFCSYVPRFCLASPRTGTVRLKAGKEGLARLQATPASRHPCRPGLDWPPWCRDAR
jgi:hypothetical protein